MSEQQELPARGRPVVLKPNPPGLWWVLLGVGLAGLAPLFGFLIGSMIGVNDTPSGNDPIFVGLSLGLIIGGAGVAWAIAGGVRWWRSEHAGTTDATAETPAGTDPGDGPEPHSREDSRPT